jgi:hypothetical protein
MALTNELFEFRQRADASRSEERVLSLSYHPSPEVRRGAASVLAAHARHPAFRSRLMAMFGDEDRNVARKAVIDARFHRIAPNDEELNQALVNPNDQIAGWHVLLIHDLQETTLARVLGAFHERPTLAVFILPKLTKRLTDSRVRKVFLNALSSDLVDVRACAYRTLAADVQSAARYPELKSALLDTVCDLEEVLGPTLRKLSGVEPS